MTCRCLRSLIALALVAQPIPPLAADSLVQQPGCHGQVRTTDRRLRAAVTAGVRDSATFRALFDRINTSDVVVYLVADASVALPPGIDGQLTFVSSAGGFRYVVVRVNPNVAAWRLVALLGHELQHAREIADTGTIVDSRSLAREYASRLGHQNRGSRHGHQTFDSIAAIRAGEQVLREMSSRRSN